MFDLSIGHTFTERFSVNVGIPFLSSSWGIPSPLTAGPDARANQHGRGLGAISAGARYWLLPTGKFRSGNIALGVGMKFPTGNDREQDTYPAIGDTGPWAGRGKSATLWGASSPSMSTRHAPGAGGSNKPS